MKKSTLQEMNDSDLIRRKNTLKGVLTGFGILFIIAIGTKMSLSANKPFNPILFVPSFLFPLTMLPVFVQYNATKLKKNLEKYN